MRIAFLTREDPRLRNSWSGILYFMLRALEQQCEIVTPLGPAAGGWWLAGKVARRLTRVVLRKNIDYSHTVALSRILGRTFSRKLSRLLDGVLLFAYVASIEVDNLNIFLLIGVYDT